MKISLPSILLVTTSLNGVTVLANTIRRTNKDKNDSSAKSWTDKTKTRGEARLGEGLELNSREDMMASGSGRRLRNKSNNNYGKQRAGVNNHSVDMSPLHGTKNSLNNPGVYHSKTLLAEQRRELSPAADISTRIIGGDQAEQGEFPYYVDLHGCGGSLIAPNAVLTAAHCRWIRGEEVIVGGYEKSNLAYGGYSRTVVSEINHPYHNETTREWDFKLLRLNAPVNEVSLLGLVLNDLPDVPFDAEPLTVLGLGAVSTQFTKDGTLPEANFLQDVDLLAVSTDRCSNYQMLKGKIFGDSMLCAGVDEGGKDSCYGDSGGPIVIRDGIFRHIQVGVVSWGHGCAEPDTPGIYSRVSGAYNWIQDTVCGQWRGTGALCDNYTPMTPTEPIPTVPASSPAGATSCADLGMDLVTDAYSNEVDVVLYDELTGELIWNKRDFLDKQPYTFQACLQRNGCYMLDVADKGQNGLEKGKIKVEYDGQTLLKEKKYGAGYAYEFGTGC